MAGNYGFIHEKIDIKVLILFIMRRLYEPVTFDVLAELTLCDDGIGYFDYADCVAELVKTGHIKCEGNEYSITGKGIYNGGITENNLPFTVRMKAEKGALKLRASLSRDAMIKTSSSNNPQGGVNVNLSLSDGIGEIVKMELFAANADQARALEKGFRMNAESIYHAIIEMILGK